MKISSSFEKELTAYVKRVRKRAADVYRENVKRIVQQRIRETLSILYNRTPPPRSKKASKRAMLLGQDYFQGKYSRGNYRKKFRFSIINSESGFNYSNPESESLQSSYNSKINSKMFYENSKVVFTNIAKKDKYNFYYSGLVDLYGWGDKEPWSVFAQTEDMIVSVWTRPITIGVKIKR